MELTDAKFGGTSVGSAEALRAAVDIVRKDESIRFVVLSAVSGTTNRVVELSNISSNVKSNSSDLNRILEELRELHRKIIEDLDLSIRLKHNFNEWSTTIEKLCEEIRFSSSNGKKELSELLLFQGEWISTRIFETLLDQASINCQLIDSRNLLVTDSNFGKAEPDAPRLQSNCKKALTNLRQETRIVYVTQGFVGATGTGATTTLGRGGSDFSAALFAEAIAAKKLQIWTDVPGIKSIDPRVSDQAKPIERITFAEAAEMANFGAKILHPATLEPARRSGVEVYIGSTRRPELGGTTIDSSLDEEAAVRAVAIRRNQTLITVTSPRMLNTHGFLAKMFAALAEHKVSVDLVTTSEVSVALTIDSAGLSSCGESITSNEALLSALHQLGDVKIEDNLSLIALIGNSLQSTPGISARTFYAVGQKNVRLICQGASSHNLCFLVDAKESEEVACSLHRMFIESANALNIDSKSTFSELQSLRSSEIQ